MSKTLIKGFFCALAFSFTTASFAGYVGDPIAMDAPYDLGFDDQYDQNYSAGDNSGYSAGDDSVALSLNPSEFGYEFMGPMDLRRGGGKAKVHQAYLYAHLIKQNPEDKFSIGLDLITRMTWFSASSNSILKSDRLYSAGLNLSGTYSFTNDTRLFFGGSATLSSDLDAWTSDCLQLGVRAGISHRFSDRFSVQVGAYYTPQIPNCPVLPIIGFRYAVNDQWYIQLDPMRFRAINTVNETFSWGPFVGIQAASWNMKIDGHHTRFSQLSGVCGLQANIVLGDIGGTKPTLTTEVGFTFSNEFEYRTSNGRHKIETVRADPGLFIKAGIKFSF